jgi:hippurate hydrolase
MAGMPEEKLPLVKIESAETPPVINNQELSEKISGFAAGIIGSKNIVKTAPAMVGEDFGKYGRTPENIPICLIWLGSTSAGLMKELNAKGEKPFPLHSPYLNPDYEKTIETGIKVMTGNVIGLMGK